MVVLSTIAFSLDSNSPFAAPNINCNLSRDAVSASSTNLAKDLSRSMDFAAPRLISLASTLVVNCDAAFSVASLKCLIVSVIFLSTTDFPSANLDAIVEFNID